MEVRNGDRTRGLVFLGVVMEAVIFIGIGCLIGGIFVSLLTFL
jgi:hypothetical protein